MSFHTFNGQPMGFPSERATREAIKHLLEDAYRKTPRELALGREPFVNAYEACLRAQQVRVNNDTNTTYTPEIYIGPHPSYPHLLCYADNGDGLSEKEVEAHLNTICQSGNTKFLGGERIGSFDENKGTGVKASLLPENKAGLNYCSIRQDNPGTARWFRLAYVENGEEEFPGLKLLGSEDGYGGDPTAFVEIDADEQDALMPFPWIRQAGHGTVLTLMGSSPEGLDRTIDSTAVFQVRTNQHGSSGTAATGLWKFLNRRFWNIEQVKVRIHTGDNADTTPRLATATGAERYLEQMATKGTCQLHLPDGSPFTLRWYIAEHGGKSGKVERKVRAKGGANFDDKGHFAFKYRGEIYRRYFENAQYHRRILSQLGIFEGSELVFLYADLDTLPTGTQRQLGTNETRMELYFADQHLEHGLFAEEFCQLLNSRHPSVEALDDYRRGVNPPNEDDQENRRRLSERLKELGAPMLDKSVNTDKEGDALAENSPRPLVTTGGAPTGELEEKAEGKPAPQPIVRVRPKGAQTAGVETWHNSDRLPPCHWSAEEEPDIAASYSPAGFVLYERWPGIQSLHHEMVDKAFRRNPQIDRGWLARQAWALVKGKIEESVVSYVYLLALECKRTGTPFELAKKHRCSEEILTSRTVLSLTDRRDLQNLINNKANGVKG